MLTSRQNQLRRSSSHCNCKRKLLIEKLESRRVLSFVAAVNSGDFGTESFEFVPGEIIVGFEGDVVATYTDRGPQAALKHASDTVAGFGLHSPRALFELPASANHNARLATQWKLQAGSDVLQAAARLSADAAIAYAEPNWIQQAALTPNDLHPDLWGLHNTGQTGGTADADIDAVEAWEITTGTNNVVVGVIDTGIDYEHIDLAANMWVNPDEIAGNGEDDDDNGYIDDVYGWDFVGDDSDPWDDNSHGTHVSGTIGGLGNNDTGVVGVNWNVDLMALKFLDSGGGGSTVDAIAAVNYATLMRQRYNDPADGYQGANVVLTSNSWGGGGFSQALEDAIALSRDANMLFVAAAGNANNDNDASPHYPSSYALDNIIAVAATDHNDDKASFSSFGAESVDLGAPGVETWSTIPHDGYGFKSGTSMATPHVAGVAAQAWGIAGDVPYTIIRDAILDGVDPVDSMTDVTVTGGRLNAYNTLQNVGMVVTHTNPAGGQVIVAIPDGKTPPTDFAVTFSFDIDPTTLDASDFNMTPSGGLSKTPDAEPAFTFDPTNPKSVVFHYATSPIIDPSSGMPIEGEHTMHMAAGSVETGSSVPSDPLLRAWNAKFRYDAQRMNVQTTNPLDGELVELPMTQLSVTLSEPYDADTADLGDLILSQGSVASVVTDPAETGGVDTVIYNVIGIEQEEVLTVTIPDGALTDVYGNPMAAYTSIIGWNLDWSTTDYPVPLAAKPPLGSLIYDPTVRGFISDAGTSADSDSFTIDVEAGHTITVVADPDAGLTPMITLTGPGLSLPSVTAAGPGSDAVIQTATATTSGEYTITISGAGATVGGYALQLILNAAIEDESHDGASNDTFSAAQNIGSTASAQSGSFIELLPGGPQRGAVLGVVAAQTGTSFVDDKFVTGTLSQSWKTYSSSNSEGRIQVTDQFGTASGDFALLMDRDPEGADNLNEAIWTVDLSAQTEAVLSFWHADFRDGESTFNGDFRNHADADGIAIRDATGKGKPKWHPIWNAPNQPDGEWLPYHIDVAAAAAEHGVDLSSNFEIKFQQFGNSRLPDGGRGWDDLVISVPNGSTNEDWYQFHLDARDDVTVLMSSSGDAHVALYAEDGVTKLADGGATAANMDEVLERADLEIGDYFLRVTGNPFFSTSAVSYNLALVVGAEFDQEDNSTVEMSQQLEVTYSYAEAALLEGDAIATGYLGGASFGDAVIGYFTDYSSTSTNPEEAILQAGLTPLQITDISTFDFSTIDVLMINEASNGGLSSELEARLPDIEAWVLIGGVVMVHDRFVSDDGSDPQSNPFLIGTTIQVDRDFVNGADIDVIPAGDTLVINGPGGVIDDTTLDGGNFSNHGFALEETLPSGAVSILSAGAVASPNDVVTLSYGLGSGAVIYSTIPLDFYLGSDNNFNNVYAPNVIVYAFSLSQTDSDFYQITVPADVIPAQGGEIHLSVTLPGAEPSTEFDNDLRHKLRLYDSATGADALSTSDTGGELQYAIAASATQRTFYIEVLSATDPPIGPTTGEYVLDVDVLPAPPPPGLTVNKTSLVTHEDPLEPQDSFTVRLDTMPTSTVTVAITTDASEAIVSATSLTFSPTGTDNLWSEPQIVQITGVDDDVDEGDASYIVNIAASGGDYAGLSRTLSAINIDDDTAGITVSKSSLITFEDSTKPSDTFVVKLSSQPTNAVTVTVTSNNVDEGVVSPSVLTFNPSGDNLWSDPQTVTVSGVDDDPALNDGDVEYLVTVLSSSADAKYQDLHTVLGATNLDNELGISEPDGFGYQAEELLVNFLDPGQYYDISGSGNSILSVDADDDAEVLIRKNQLEGFEFSLYGRTYNQVIIGGNGQITFEWDRRQGSARNNSPTNQDLSTEPQVATVAPLWDDLEIAGPNAAVYWEVRGSGDSQQLVVQFEQIRFWGEPAGDDTITFQVILYESSGAVGEAIVQFLYPQLNTVQSGAGGASATVGIKDIGDQIEDGITTPNRLLLSFNEGPNDWVGNGKTTLITYVGLNPGASLNTVAFIPVPLFLGIETPTRGRESELSSRIEPTSAKLVALPDTDNRQASSARFDLALASLDVESRVESDAVLRASIDAAFQQPQWLRTLR